MSAIVKFGKNKEGLEVVIVEVPVKPYVNGNGNTILATVPKFHVPDGVVRNGKRIALNFNMMESKF